MIPAFDRRSFCKHRNFCPANDKRRGAATPTWRSTGGMKPNALLISKKTSDSNGTITQAVSRAGFALLQATDAQSAFALLKNSLPEIDLVIVDVDPGIHGMAILEAITARDTSPPVIVVTGFEQFEMAPIARRHGAAACIAKPFTAAEFIARIEDVCPGRLPVGRLQLRCLGSSLSPSSQTKRA